MTNGLSVANVAVELGFHDQSHFHRHFKKAVGVAPGGYAKQVTPGHQLKHKRINAF